MPDIPIDRSSIAAAAGPREATFVVGMGEVLWDVLPQGRQIGGAPANFAFHVSQLDVPAVVVSATGNDALGREARQVFARHGLDSLMMDVPFPTGTVQVSVDPEGVPDYEIRKDVAWDHIPFTPRLLQLAAEARAVCWGTLAQRAEESRETILRFVDLVPNEPDRLKIFDINLRQHFYSKKVIEESLRRCNVFKLNVEELRTVSRLFDIPKSDVESRCRCLLARYGLRMLILTCGAEGSYVLTPAATSFVETPKVEVADTVGAGDAFTAAMAVSLVQGMSVPEAHRRAVRVSAYVCTRHGAMPILPPDRLKA